MHLDSNHFPINFILLLSLFTLFRVYKYSSVDESCIVFIIIVYLVISSFSSCPFFFFFFFSYVFFFVAIITSVCDYYNCLRERELQFSYAVRKL